MKRSTKSRTFWMLDDMDEDINSNISSTRRATHTPMTYGLITRTYMRLTFLKNSILPTPLQLDELKYKKPNVSHQSIPIPLFYLSQPTRKIPPLLLSLSPQSTCLVLPLQFTSPHTPPLQNLPIRTQATLHSPLHPLLLSQTTFQSHQ